jgi:acyl-CoA thioester hydrolase
VPFYETDAMGIVHHSNHVRYYELGRIAFLEQHDQPYEQYVASGMHFATTRVEVDYHHPARFADVVEITVWAEAVRFASLRMAYVLRVGDHVIATGATEHAAVDESGKVRRLPKDRRKALLALVGKTSAG